jgi:hypothetical protein
LIFKNYYGGVILNVEIESLPNTETSAIIELVFPHLLMISRFVFSKLIFFLKLFFIFTCVRISPFAVNLAVKLPSSISLLYESIGHLQV